MADDWLKGLEHIPIPTVNGGTWAEDDPDRVALHTTEGSSIEGAIATWRNSKVPSHLVADLSLDRTVQCLPFNVSAYALKNLPGGVETNRVGRTIQIEIVGFAKDSPNRPPIELQRLGRLLRRIHDEGGVDFKYEAPIFVGPEAGTIASVNAPQRMSQAAWRAFNGVCGHQHVPENDHWDPGHLDIQTVLKEAGQTAVVPPKKKVKTMFIVRGDQRPEVYLTDRLTKRHMQDQKELDGWIWISAVAGDPLQGARDANNNVTNAPMVLPQVIVDRIADVAHFGDVGGVVSQAGPVHMLLELKGTATPG